MRVEGRLEPPLAGEVLGPLEALQKPGPAGVIEAKRTVVQSATARLRSAMGKAISALEDVLDDKETPAAVRVSCARVILEMAFRSHEIEDIEERIALLEGRNK